MARIRAAVARAFGAPLSIEEVEIRDPGPDEVMVALEACAICHSDVSLLDGGWGGPLPAVYGHEASGRVIATGPGADGLAPGTPVLVTLIRACGSCPSCAAGAPVLCETPHDPVACSPLALPDGTPVAQGLDTAAFAERVVVHRSQVVPLPEGLAMDAAALLSCGVITGVGAVVNTAGVRPGQNVVVIGAGGVGLNAIQGARLAGAARIIAMDLSETKLEDAHAFGATDGVLATVEKPWREVARITRGRMADAVLVTVGATAAYDLAPRLLARGGQVVMVGMPHSGERASYEPVILSVLGQGMRGTKMGDAVPVRDIPWLVDLWKQGRLMVEELVSARWPLEEINAAIADTRAGRARRNVIVFGRS